ncbi:MAG: DUF4097 family beta strand repeat protein [Acidobacteria bacterium]|nr:DUF4097 family beta strand repeat protein [Acidobacteriota bacterium]
MRRFVKKLSAVWLAAACLCLAASAARAQQAAAKQKQKEKVTVTMKDRIEFAEGGTLNLQGTWGEVTVEGWDQPFVEITLDKTTNKKYAPKNEAQAQKALAKFGYTVKKDSAASITLAGFQPSSNLLTRPFGGKSAVKLVYTIKVPRRSNVNIDHSMGVVAVNDVSGDLAVKNRIGEVSLKLPENGQFTVDARSKVGDVSSSARFLGDNGREHVVGQKLVSRQDERESHRVFVRVQVGAITVR